MIRSIRKQLDDQCNLAAIPFLAMAQHRLGDHDEASKLLDRLRQLL